MKEQSAASGGLLAAMPTDFLPYGEILEATAARPTCEILTMAGMRPAKNGMRHFRLPDEFYR